MGISTKHEVEHFDSNKRLVIKGVLEHHSAGELCKADEKLEAGELKLKRTQGGGISYSLEVVIVSPAPEPSAADLDAVSDQMKAAEDSSE